MCKLKVHKAYNRWIDEEMPTHNDDLICNEFYLKAEADKVIADLEESHKKEVGQLLMEIVELKHQRDGAFGLTNLGLTLDDLSKMSKKEIDRQKFKRCLAMAKWCKTSARYDEGLGAFKYRDWYWKWFKRWMKLAEQLKEAK